jgi:hypothetical protein
MIVVAVVGLVALSAESSQTSDQSAFRNQGRLLQLRAP